MAQIFSYHGRLMPRRWEVEDVEDVVSSWNQLASRIVICPDIDPIDCYVKITSTTVLDVRGDREARQRCFSMSKSSTSSRQFLVESRNSIICTLGKIMQINTSEYLSIFGAPTHANFDYLEV